MKKSNGITLIALIITIIIMLILVAVSISILINSGLIGKAKEGAQKKKTAYEEESRMGDSLNINGVMYNSIDEFIGDLDGGESVTIAQGENTFPYLPDNNSTITNNDLSTGLTVKDSHQNEWVWIEVPTSIYTNSAYNTESTTGDMQPANSEDYVKIRYCLEKYAETLIPEGSSEMNQRPSTWKDYWYYYVSSGTVYSKDPLTGNQYKNNTANSDDISTYLTSTDGTKGTGLTYSQYETKYKAMLKSTYENGGFYIGKYETGTETARGAANNALTTAIIKENAYPYNYVTCSQAEAQAETLATGRKNNKFIIWSAMGFSIKTFK